MVPRLSYNLHVFLTVLLLLSMTIYNSQIVVFRVFFVLYFLVVPVIYVWVYQARISVNHKSLVLLFLSISFFIYVLISLIYNADTLSFSITGPMVEFLTPLLFLSSFFIYTYLSHQTYDVLRSSISIYVYLLIIILIFDVIWRYSLNHECFMNYSCRKEAKIIGFFSTTNVIGTFMLYLLFALHKAHFPIIKKLFIGILFTAMSRAAIVTLLFVTFFNALLRSSAFIKLSVLVVFFAVSSYIFIFNPLGIINDGSLLSKFEFISSAISSLENATSSEILFGFGASFESVTRVVGVEGWSPHSPFLKAYFYYGLIGLIFYLLINLYFLFLDFRFFFIILLAAFINGIAGAPIYNPTIWVCFAIFLLYQRRSKNA